MLLERLVQYADALSSDVPPMYDLVPVRYIVDIDSGTFRGSIITQTGEAGRRADRGRVRAVPTLVRSNAIKPKLLADNGEYALGWPREDGDEQKVESRHQAFVDLVALCAERTGNRDVQIVQDFLAGDGLRKLDRPDDFDAAQIVTFQIDGRAAIDDADVQSFWNDHMSGESSDSADRTECIVCGQLVTPVERLQFKIKGVPGGQTSGTSLISANADAFESYGLRASHVSPICHRCAEQFSKALNSMIGDERHRLYAGGQLFLFWSEDDSQFTVIDFLNRPDPASVREFIARVFTGRDIDLTDHTRFHAVSLSGSGGRLVVRDWIDTTLGSARQNLAEYFQLQRIVQPDGSEPRPYGLNALVRSTVREQSNEDPAPLVPRALVRSALLGTPVPFWIAGQIIRRIRASQGVTGPQAALLKMVLLSADEQIAKEELVELDQHNADPAYLCGRLLAVLDATQRAALGTRNATIIDRFFGTASSAPASVFGRLLRGAQPHLARLRRDRPGAHVALERRMEEIMAQLQGFPKTLSMQEQARFVLGYYHQRAYDRSQAREAAERRRRGQTADPEAQLADVIEESEQEQVDVDSNQ